MAKSALPLANIQTSPRLTIALWICFPLCAFFGASGGLGLAATAALGGLISLRPSLLFQSLKRPPLSIVLFILAIAWTLISLSWSPYTKPDQAIKLGLLTPLFIAFVYAAWHQGERQNILNQKLTLFASIGLISFFCFEGLTSGAITKSFELLEWPIDNIDYNHIQNLVNRTLSRGSTVALLFVGSSLLILKRTPKLKIFIPILLIGAFVTASQFGNEANLVALTLSVISAYLAYKHPRILSYLIIAIALIACLAPLLAHLLILILDDSFNSALPMSWAWRLEIWSYALERISEKPIFGHGLDAARTFKDTTLLRGISIELMPLHAHNAALHIWMETGLIGVLLLSCALCALAYQIHKTPLPPHLTAALTWTLVMWSTCVLLGYGIWQEWHHGALAMAFIASFSVKQPQT